MKLSSEQKQQIERLIRSGNKIEAIKQLRNIGDVGLAEAKALVDALERGGDGDHRPAAHAPAPRSLKEAEQAALAALRDNNVVEAIKRYRKHTKLGLKESKDAVDALLVVHRSEGRINLKVAQALITMIAEGRKDDALTHVMSHAGYDDPEARALIKSIGKMRPGAASCAGGCLRFIIALALIGGVLWYALQQSGLLAGLP